MTSPFLADIRPENSVARWNENPPNWARSALYPSFFPLYDSINTMLKQVYEMSDEEAEQAVYWALEAGYRHIDSAEWCVCFIPFQKVSYLSIDLQVRERRGLWTWDSEISQ